jgi:hypothetical protein
MLFRETVALAAVKMMRANRGRFTTAVVILGGNSGAAGSSLGSSLDLVSEKSSAYCLLGHGAYCEDWSESSPERLDVASWKPF